MSVERPGAASTALFAAGSAADCDARGVRLATPLPLGAAGAAGASATGAGAGASVRSAAGLAVRDARLAAGAAGASSAALTLTFADSAPCSLARSASAMVRGPLRRLAAGGTSATAMAVLAEARLRTDLTAVSAEIAAVSKSVSSLILRGSGAQLVNAGFGEWIEMHGVA